MSCTRVKDHVLFVKGKGARYPPGIIQFGFYLMYFEESEIGKNPCTVHKTLKQKSNGKKHGIFLMKRIMDL